MPAFAAHNRMAERARNSLLYADDNGVRPIGADQTAAAAQQLVDRLRHQVVIDSTAVPLVLATARSRRQSAVLRARPHLQPHHSSLRQSGGQFRPFLLRRPLSRIGFHCCHLRALLCHHRSIQRCQLA